MMETLIEKRYPYNNALDFFIGGYWLRPEALHILLAWVFVMALVLIVLRYAPGRTAFKLSILFFALAVYNNPAFEYRGLKINEYFGILAVGVYFLRLSVSSLHSDFLSPTVLSLSILFLMACAHTTIIGLAYSGLTPNGFDWLIKIAIHLKVLVLVLNLWVVGNAARKSDGFDFLIKCVVVCGSFGALMYLTQVIVLMTGTVPYGTYSDAGFQGLPSFGAVSIERGHFGKMMAPLAPFFLYALVQYRWRMTFALFALVSLINISASSLSFFVIFCALSAWVYRGSLVTHRNLYRLLFVASAFVALLWINLPFYLGAVHKIYDLAIAGDQENIGGRTLRVLVEYLNVYPLGIGYSGSLFRTAPNLPEINSGFYAFISQFSVLAPVIIFWFGLLVCRTLYRLYLFEYLVPAIRCLSIGVMLSMFVFFVDILWFIPTIWLSYELIWSVRYIGKHRALEVPVLVRGLV